MGLDSPDILDTFYLILEHLTDIITMAFFGAT